VASSPSREWRYVFFFFFSLSSLSRSLRGEGRVWREKGCCFLCGCTGEGAATTPAATQNGEKNDFSIIFRLSRCCRARCCWCRRRRPDRRAARRAGSGCGLSRATSGAAASQEGGGCVAPPDRVVGSCTRVDSRGAGRLVRPHAAGRRGRRRWSRKRRARLSARGGARQLLVQGEVLPMSSSSARSSSCSARRLGLRPESGDVGRRRLTGGRRVCCATRSRGGLVHAC
jgi:hypothetical protein